MVSTPPCCFLLTLSVVDSIRFNVFCQQQLHANLQLSFWELQVSLKSIKQVRSSSVSFCSFWTKLGTARPSSRGFCHASRNGEGCISKLVILLEKYKFANSETKYLLYPCYATNTWIQNLWAKRLSFSVSTYEYSWTVKTKRIILAEWGEPTWCCRLLKCFRLTMPVRRLGLM